MKTTSACLGVEQAPVNVASYSLTTMSLVLIEDNVQSFGELIASCWDDSSRCSIIVSGSETLDQCLLQVSRNFEVQFGRKPIYASLHKIHSLTFSQTLGIQIE